jgi:protein O-mannosyl-transferase
MKERKAKSKKENTIGKPAFKNRWSIAGFILAGLILSLFSQTFNFEFVNWDDHVNVYENENVINFDVKGVFTEHVIGNYNPLSNLTLALEYKIVQNSPKLYHFNNVLLHIICSLLVFFLMKKLGMSFFVSFLVALLFGIHPMRVESVAWITERKDVLFGMLYLGSLLLYISYLKTKKSVYYILSLLVFSLSLLSKIQAVALPFSIILIDYWFEKKLTLKSGFEKIPFFLLSMVTGLVGIYFLRQQGSLDVGNTLPIFQRLFIGSYSYMVYIIKSVIPYQISALYVFPTKLAFIHYISMVPALAVLLVTYFSFKTKRIFTFGILFFTLNIVFMLQVVGAGQGFIADRFTYIPYIGLFIIYAVVVENLLIKFPAQKILIYSTLALYLFLISFQTIQQIKVWENSKTLWTDVIKKQSTAALAYNNLGHYYSQKNEPDKALENFNVAIQLEPNKAQTYSDRGKIYFDRGEFELALEDYNKSLSIDPEFLDALANRGAVYGIKNQYDKAIEDLSKVIKTDPDYADAISNRGFAYYRLNEYKKTIADCNLYLQIKPNDTEILNLAGLCYANLNDFEAAINKFSQAIQIEPTKAIFFANRSNSFNSNGDKTSALKDALQAKQLGFNVNPAYIEMLSNQ